MNSYELKVVTPSGSAFEGSVNELIVRTESGDVGILAGHIDYFAVLNLCAAKIRMASGVSFRALCGGGFLKVSNEETVIVTDIFQKDSEINKDSAEKEYNECLEKLNGAKNEQEKTIFAKALARAEIKKEIATE